MEAYIGSCFIHKGESLSIGVQFKPMQYSPVAFDLTVLLCSKSV